MPYAKYATKSGLKSEVASSHLSWLWWILDPILFMLVYWFIFMVIFGQKKEYFHIFVFVGLSMWNLFNKTVSGSVRIVIVMMLWSHVPVSYNVIYVIPIFVDLILITFGVSAILAHFGVFFDDLKNITNVGLRILFYMSGIFYVITDRVNEAIATLLLKVNPVGFLIDACRSSLVYCETPHRRLILLWFVIGSVCRSADQSRGQCDKSTKGFKL